MRFVNHFKYHTTRLPITLNKIIFKTCINATVHSLLFVGAKSISEKVNGIAISKANIGFLVKLQEKQKTVDLVFAGELVSFLLVLVSPKSSKLF